MELQAQLVHAEPGSRVVRVSAREGERSLGSALGEASDAEQAEERALARLLARLQIAPAAPPAAPSAAPSAAPPHAPPGPAPQAAVAPTRPSPRPPLPGPTAAPPQPAVLEPAVLEPAQPDPAAAGPEEPPSDPEDWSDELARIDLQRQRLGWSREQEEIYLERAFGHPSRSRLTSWANLKAFLRALEGFTPGLDPTSAPVPLRRPELISQCDALLAQLGWTTAQARRFLELGLGLSSRSQLSDEQLLQFNLLLETELIRADPDPAAKRSVEPATADPTTAPA